MSGPREIPKRKRPDWWIESAGNPLDRPFLVMMIILLAVGYVMMCSASVSDAYYYEGNSYYYIKHQLRWICLGLLAMWLFSHLDHHIWMGTFAWLAYALSIILLLLCLVAMPAVNNAKRWIISGGFSFQPSEIAKFALVILYATMLTQKGIWKKIQTLKVGFLPFAGTLMVMAGLILVEPHISATVLIVLIAGIMLIAGRWPWKWVLLAFALLVAGLFVFRSVPTLWERALVRINAWKDPYASAQETGYQIIQSLYAIGSGGLTGMGFGNSRQKNLFLPEPQNDYIFSITAEELGFIGVTLIILLFIVFIARGFLIAMRSRDRFGSLMTIGFMAQVGCQTALNIAVVTNSIPSTGIALPFFSYGGTAIAILLGEMGIILSVSRDTARRKRESGEESK